MGGKEAKQNKAANRLKKADGFPGFEWLWLE
jgi:hypothetical protein